MRAFAAVTVPEEIRALYSKTCRGMRDSGEISIVRPNKMHITLAFFDGLKNEDIEKVKEALTSLELEPMEVRCVGLGKFDRRGEPSVVYVDTRSDLLASFTDAFHKNLRKLGVPYDNKSFKPHLTIARIKQMKDLSLFKKMYTGACLGFKESAFNIDKISLFSSDMLTYKEIFAVDFPVGEKQSVRIEGDSKEQVRED